MKTGFALAILITATLTPGWTHAAKKNAKGGSMVNAGMPSAQIEPLLEPCLDAILAPLEKDPKMPRVEVEKLHSTFAAGQVKAGTPARQQIYQNAMAVCESLTKGMDDRAREKAAALAAAKTPTLSTGGAIVKSSPIRGADAGANAEAIRKKQKDERKYADKDARTNSTFVESGAYKAWNDKATRLRQNVMALYTKQMQLEAFEEKNAVAVAEKPVPVAATPPAPVVVKPPVPMVAKTPEKSNPPPEKKSSAKSVSFAGTWAGPARSKTYVVKDDHTAIKTDRDGDKVNGKWNIDTDGDIEIRWDDQTRFMGKLSEDGQTLVAKKGGGGGWTRQKP